MNARRSSASAVVRRGGGGWLAPSAATSTSSPPRLSLLPSSVFRWLMGGLVPDLKRWAENDRTIAAAVELQLAGIDPDSSRALADRIVFRIDRVGMRGHGDAAPTDDEIRRAQNELNRRGHAVSSEDVFAALDAAFIRGWSV